MIKSTNVTIVEEQVITLKVRDQQISISLQDAEELRDVLIEFFNNYYGKTRRQD